MPDLYLTPEDVRLLDELWPAEGVPPMSDRAMDRLLKDCLAAPPPVYSFVDPERIAADRRRCALVAACVDRDNAQASARNWRLAFCGLLSVVLTGLLAFVIWS